TRPTRLAPDAVSFTASALPPTPPAALAPTDALPRARIKAADSDQLRFMISPQPSCAVCPTPTVRCMIIKRGQNAALAIGAYPSRSQRRITKSRAGDSQSLFILYAYAA